MPWPVGAKLEAPGPSGPGASLRSVVELNAHVLTATARTLGRTSAPNAPIPEFV
ncbi:MAG: hypothetical protein AVDCRST_MAG05-2163 [uncultured Rubrobacteraceae bacterium]|uniref:Uncharacterized protein n=1 Tax=uncultured Rubrobacteraceae bacterium TaxID=349277 RepID=A0A6J4SDZ9_9ACTN|nr:MAG: hypothetical protein AVDCRST_MAG05-2163 [uncultured Rubrobacteraceae bacterium]